MSKLLNSVVILACLICVGCESGPTQREQLTSFGVLGEKPVLRMDRLASQTGGLYGSFYFGSGSIGGSMSTQMNLIFYWEPKPHQILASQVPYSKFRIFVDDKYDQPTVEFIFDDGWLNYFNPDTLKEDSINEYINSSMLDSVHIHISQKTLASEIYLPK